MFQVLRRAPAPRGDAGAHRDRGAAAVEFALVSVALFPMLFGVVDYGIYLADVMSVQRAAGQVARSATLPPAAGLPVAGDVVGALPPGGTGTGTGTEGGGGGGGAGTGEARPCDLSGLTADGLPLQELAALDLRGPLDRALCSALTTVDTLTGPVSVRAAVVPPGDAPAGTWGTGSSLRVCVIADHSALTPFTPLPNGGRIRTRVDMPVEPQSAVPLDVPVRTIESAGEDGSAKDWTWCGA